MADSAVDSRFEDQLLPVAATRSPARYGPGCAFSDMANTVQVWIDASTDPADADADTDCTIDGHPATLPKGPGRVSLAVVYDTLDEPGQLIGKLMTDLTENHL